MKHHENAAATETMPGLDPGYLTARERLRARKAAEGGNPKAVARSTRTRAWPRDGTFQCLILQLGNARRKSFTPSSLTLVL